MSKPFYVAGGTLPADAPSYVARRADHDLLDGLLAGEFCYVLDTRQMGKSSLMVRAAARLRELGIAVAVLDLTAIGHNVSIEEWYDGLVNQFGRELGLEDELDGFLRAHRHLGALQRFMAGLQWAVGADGNARGDDYGLDRAADAPEEARYRSSLVVFVDEIDGVRGLPFSTDEFFAAIRECYNLRARRPELNRLTFCLLGVATPASLVRDTQLTPFNIGRRIDLQDFTESEAAPLAMGLCLRCSQGGCAAQTWGGAPAAPCAGPCPLARVLYWTGGHPYLTQRLCQKVSGISSNGGVAPAARGRKLIPQSPGRPLGFRVRARRPATVVDAACDELFLSGPARERDDNLLFVRDRIVNGEADLTSVLDLYRQVLDGKRVRSDDLRPCVTALMLSGIVRAEGGFLRVRNRIYARVFGRAWIRDRMPDAELRRQRAAYRRGVVRATSVAAIILLVMLGLVWTAVGFARRAEMNHRVAVHREKEAKDAARRLAIALDDAIAQHRRADQEADQARRKEHRALRAERLANSQRTLAERKTAESQRSLHRLSVDTGLGLLEQGDPLGALPWFAESMRLDGEARAQRRVDGLRFEIALRSAPRLAGAWWRSVSTGVAAVGWPSGPYDVPGFLPGNEGVIVTAPDGSPLAWNVRTGACYDPVPLAGPGAAALCLSPGGRYLLTADPGGLARLWDTSTGRPASPPLRHPAPIELAAVSAGGSTVCTLCADRRIRAWSARTGRQTVLCQATTFTSLDVNADGTHIVTATGVRFKSGSAQVWDAASGSRVGAPFSPGVGIERVRFSPDGRLVALALDGPCALWTVGSSPPKIVGPAVGWLFDAAFSPDGKRVVTGGIHGMARVWETANGRPISPPIPHAADVFRVAFSPDGLSVATGSADGTVRVWNAMSGQPVSPWLPHSSGMRQITFSRDGRYLLVTCVDRTTRLWDLAGCLRSDTRFPCLAHHRPRLSLDGRRIVTVTSERSARILDAATGRFVTPALNHTRAINSVNFSPDGRRVVTASEDATAQLWDAETGARLGKTLKHRGGVRCAAFSPDSRWIVTCGVGDPIQIWSASTFLRRGGPLRPEVHVTGIVYGTDPVVFSPDGRYLAAMADGATHIWDLGSLRHVVLRTAGTCSLAFSPDSRRLATQNNATFRAEVWDVRSARLIARTAPHRGVIFDASFSPDGARIVTASYDGTAQIWSASTGRPLSPPLRHSTAVWDARFSPDGRLVVSSGDDGTGTRLWDASSGALVGAIAGGGPAADFGERGQRILTAAATWQIGAVWRLPPVDRPVAQAIRLAELVSCRHVDQELGPVPTELRSQQETWRRLGPRYRAEYRATPADVAAWRAHDSATVAAGDSPADVTLWYRLALLHLAAGDQAEYERACGSALTRFGASGDPGVLNVAAWTCALGDVDRADTELAIRLAERAVAAEPTSGRLNTLGAVLYRGRRFADAVRRLHESVAAEGHGGVIEDWVFLGLAYRALGQDSVARPWLTKAARALRQAELQPPTAAAEPWNRRLEQTLFRQEVESALKAPR